MSGTFAATYAGAYDDLYAEKDYAGECDYLEEALRRHGNGRTKRVLDLGCGTGNHALTLAERGYEVAGVDLSPEMLAVAGAKAKARGRALDLHVGDVRTTRVPGEFDAALFMFAVLGYLTDTADLLAAFRNARAHLRAGGLLLFDVWYGPAVLALRPLERAKVWERDGRTTIRLSHPGLRADRDVVDVRIRLWHISSGAVEATSDETHSVRYFFVPELTEYLRLAGFEPLAYDAFPDLDAGPDERSWNLGCVAVAK